MAVVRIMVVLGGVGGWDLLSNWLSFGEKETQVGLEMNGAHYVFYGSELAWLRSCSMCATVTPFFPSGAMSPLVLRLVLSHANQTLVQ